MAGAAADYRFLYVAVGFPGRVNDSAAFTASKLGQKLDEVMPPDEPLPQTEAHQLMPFVAVGDEAFPLRRHLMRPFPGVRITAATPEMRQRMQTYNYRLSRARRVVENSFGILSSRFRVLLKAMDVQPSAARTIVLACVCLHNYLIVKSPAYIGSTEVDTEQTDGTIVDGRWRDEMNQLRPVRTGNRLNRAAAEANDIRLSFMEYFTGVGAVDFQDAIVNRGFC